MPIGGHTPDSPQPHAPSTPPPTDSGVCAISPSDLVGYTGNLINRVNELEQRIAELEAANVEANQLSDLSQQVGWVGGITYLGVEGWTQTEYGTLIPPPGFTLLGGGLTMSDGNQYSAVFYDEDGVLQFGFDTTGQINGEIGSQITSRNFLVVSFSSQTLDSFNEAIIFDTEQSSSGSITWSGTTITIPSPGLYAISFHLEGASWNTLPAVPTASEDLYLRVNSAFDTGGTFGAEFHFPSDSTASSTNPRGDLKTVIIHKSAGDATATTFQYRHSDGSIDINGTVTIVQLSST